MVCNNVVGIIFSNMHDSHLRELTDLRTMGSVPFGGRYRTIDFPLSNMVNSGINKVGVITKHNFQSLMDHLGSGKVWDLSRKHEGLFILPPFGYNNSIYQSRVEALTGVRNFLAQCKEEYVLLSDCHIIYTMDFQPLLDEHITKGADITIVCKNDVMPEDLPEKVRFELGRGNKITDIIVEDYRGDKSNWSMGILLMKKDFLMQIVADAQAHNRLDFIRDILQRGQDEYKMYAYKFDGFAGVLGSNFGYFDTTMKLMKKSVRDDLFNASLPIYTKVRDEMPTRFGLGSKVKNSMLADGCIIEGDVENCVLFRGVQVGAGAKITNSIIMQNTVIGENTRLNYVIADKDCVFGDGSMMSGFDSYPVYIAKASKV